MPKILYLEKTGDPIDLPLFNTFIGGISGHGKTVLAKAYVKALAEENPELSILIVDSTEDQEYRELGQEIPLCFVDTIEPFVLNDLLASVSGIYMDRYIGEIIDEMALSKTMRDGLMSMEHKLALAKKAGSNRRDENWLHPRERKNILVVATALRKLLELADRMKVIDRLELKRGINRMDLSLKGVDPNLKLGFQQLIVRSVALKIVNECRNTILLLDEAQRYIPQKWGSVAKQAVADLLGEGRKLGDFVVLASQTMVRIDKEPLYNVRYWVMGLQAHPNEVKRTVEILSDVLEGTELKPKDVKGLPDGWFWVLTKKSVQKAYARPLGMSEEVAQKVARHKLSEAEAWKMRHVTVKKEDEELNEEQVREIVRKEVKAGVAQITESAKGLREIVRDELKQSGLLMDRATVESALKAAAKFDKTTKEIEMIWGAIEALKKSKTAIIISKDEASAHRTVEEKTPDAPPLAPAWNQIVLLVDERLRELSAKGELHVVTVNVNERLRELVKEDMVQGFTSVIRDLKEPEKRILRFLALKGASSLGDAWAAFSKKAYVGKAASMLHARLTPMEHAGLIAVTENQVTWNVPTILAQTLTTEDVNQVNEYLKSLLL